MTTIYNIIRVGNVEPDYTKTTRGTKNTFTAEKSLLQNKCKCSWNVRSKGNCPCKVLAYYQNSDITQNSSTSFYSAFAKAYNNHMDIILSPDDVWFVIMLQFKKYINANSEQMRHLFVSHNGKKELTVTTWNDNEESQWEEFFILMIKAIESNTNEGVVKHLQADFSTTTIVEKMLSTAVIMDSFKNYFDYGRCIPCCGIRNVLFTGTLEDWLKLQDKLDKIKTYSIDNFWSKYVDELKPIIKQFINTYQGNVDANFWDKVMNFRYGSIGSGSTSYVSGWILKFYGIYEEVDSGDIKEELIDVPVKIDNKLTGEKKMVSIFGGFGGVCNLTGEYVQPIKKQSIEQKQSVEKNPEQSEQSVFTKIFNAINIFGSVGTTQICTTEQSTEQTTETITIEYDAFKPQMSFIVYHDGKLLNEKEMPEFNEKEMAKLNQI